MLYIAKTLTVTFDFGDEIVPNLMDPLDAGLYADTICRKGIAIDVDDHPDGKRTVYFPPHRVRCVTINWE